MSCPYGQCGLLPGGPGVCLCKYHVNRAEERRVVEKGIAHESRWFNFPLVRRLRDRG